VPDNLLDRDYIQIHFQHRYEEDDCHNRPACNAKSQNTKSSEMSLQIIKDHLNLDKKKIPISVVARSCHPTFAITLTVTIHMKRVVVSSTQRWWWSTVRTGIRKTFSFTTTISVSVPKDKGLG
jgi:hypothetical protein